MKLRKGDKVEVMNRNDAPVSWRAAEILSSNGHTYRVQYDSCADMSRKQMVEIVSRKFVRPCPPLVQGVEKCVAGDIVEVFYEFTWKMAAILSVLDGKKETKTKKISRKGAAVEKRYLVRLIGCSLELLIDESNIRMRQIWDDGKWVLIGKSSRECQDAIASKPSSTYHQKMDFQIPQINTMAAKQPRNNANVHEETAFLESDMIYSRSLKRMTPYGSSIVEAHNGRAEKLRAVEKGGKKQRVVAAPMLEKVDAVSYHPREILGEKNMHASFNIISTGRNQMERPKLNNSSDSDACSVGSCSITGRIRNNFCIPIIPSPCQDMDTDCSDAESCYGSGSERKSSSFAPKEEVKGSIRSLELHAYRRTLEAFYVSGSLSWEQEALLTNLRIMLHISNDEHLMELKNLISAKTVINFR